LACLIITSRRRIFILFTLILYQIIGYNLSMDIKPDLGKDQFFLTDKVVIKKVVGFAELTKNEAREMIVKSGIKKDLLEKHTNNSEIYDLVRERFNGI